MESIDEEAVNINECNFLVGASIEQFRDSGLLKLSLAEVERLLGPKFSHVIGNRIKCYAFNVNKNKLSRKSKFSRVMYATSDGALFGYKGDPALPKSYSAIHRWLQIADAEAIDGGILGINQLVDDCIQLELDKKCQKTDLVYKIDKTGNPVHVISMKNSDSAAELLGTCIVSASIMATSMMVLVETLKDISKKEAGKVANLCLSTDKFRNLVYELHPKCHYDGNIEEGTGKIGIMLRLKGDNSILRTYCQVMISIIHELSHAALETSTDDVIVDKRKGSSSAAAAATAAADTSEAASPAFATTTATKKHNHNVFGARQHGKKFERVMMRLIKVAVGVGVLPVSFATTDMLTIETISAVSLDMLKIKSEEEGEYGDALIFSPDLISKKTSLSSSTTTTTSESSSTTTTTITPDTPRKIVRKRRVSSE